ILIRAAGESAVRRNSPLGLALRFQYWNRARTADGPRAHVACADCGQTLCAEGPRRDDHLVGARRADGLAVDARTRRSALEGALASAEHDRRRGFCLLDRRYPARRRRDQLSRSTAATHVAVLASASTNPLGRLGRTSPPTIVTNGGIHGNE